MSATDVWERIADEQRARAEAAEAKEREVRERLGDDLARAELRISDLETALGEAVKLVGMIEPEDDDDHDMIAEFIREARDLLASNPRETTGEPR